MCKKSAPPIRMGVPETAVSLTGGKPASSAKELPPPQQHAVSDGKKNAASDNLARVSPLGQPMAHLTVKEAQREDAPPGRSPQVGFGAGEGNRRQMKEEEKQIPSLGNTDVR